jgi:hypothetical protein
MKITLNNPITVGDAVYPFALLNLSISTQYGKMDDYSVACRLVPCREIDGQIEQLTDAAFSLSSMSAIADAELSEGMQEIISAVQNFIDKKGV